MMARNAIDKYVWYGFNLILEHVNIRQKRLLSARIGFQKRSLHKAMYCGYEKYWNAMAYLISKPISYYKQRQKTLQQTSLGFQLIRFDLPNAIIE